MPDPRCHLNLDDVVTVTRNLSFTPGNSVRNYSKADLKNIVRQKLQTALYSISQSQNSILS